ncbi:hypothetical protein FRB94_004728 [Tulasnella sp. JGI-2019a]|nr:hypothetical protein FRB93_011383 [Tulasnella sp. JGI-2019a]KAG9012918.1 hypothetical protein FRB94_004728 [Tulasnella sp. JGI-2019a]
MALLFVTEPFGDVAAVTACAMPTDMNFTVMTVAKNPDRKDQFKESDVISEFTRGRTNDWLRDRLVNGLFDMKTHAGYMADLINKSHNILGQKLEETAELTRYVYSQCQLKISRRVGAKIATGMSAIRFFTLLKPAELGFSDDPLPPPNDPHQLKERGLIAAHDESWLISRLSLQYKTKIGSTVDVVNGADVAHLALNKRFLTFWIKSTVMRLVERMAQADSALKKIEVPDTKTMEKVRSCLDELATTMESVFALVHLSVAVWDLLHSTEFTRFYTTIEKRSTAKTATVDTLAKDLQSTPDAAVATPTPEDAVMENDEEPDNIPEVEPGPFPGSELRHWMKSLAMYHRALTRLIANANAYREQLFRIIVVKTSVPSQPSQQASLQDTLATVSDGSDKGIAHCQNLIKEVVEKLGRKSRDDAYWCLIGQLDVRKWEESFKGNTHCGACLACEMIKDKIPHQNNIGTSKRCCTTCTWFLEALNPSIRYSGTHGKVYPWAFPNINIDAATKSTVMKHILKKLTDHLRTSICEEDARRRCNTSDSASRSDELNHTINNPNWKPSEPTAEELEYLEAEEKERETLQSPN